jgi:hypothetical protein
MKNLFKATSLMALLCGVALAQSATPSSTSGAPQTQAQPSATQNSPQSATTPSQAQHPTRVAPGSVIPVQLTKTVDAKKAKTGDEVVAKVTMDMKTQSGDVLVPKDTKVIGHVTEAQKRDKDQKASELGLAFDRAVTKDGNTMQMPMSIQAVIGQQPQNQQSEANTPAGREEAAGVPSGAAPTSANGGKSPGTTPPPPSASTSASGAGTGAGNGDTQAANGGRPPINAQTQGVIGISNLTLSPASNGTQGSVMTSEKNNVKLESGTMLLLKVNQ